MKQPIAMAWSGGKDSSLALHRLLNDDRYDVRCLLTTVNSEYGRISMHGVRNDLLAAQAAAIACRTDERVQRGQFAFCDLLPE